MRLFVMSKWVTLQCLVLKNMAAIMPMAFEIFRKVVKHVIEVLIPMKMIQTSSTHLNHRQRFENIYTYIKETCNDSLEQIRSYWLLSKRKTTEKILFTYQNLFVLSLMKKMLRYRRYRTITFWQKRKTNFEICCYIAHVFVVNILPAGRNCVTISKWFLCWNMPRTHI